MYPLSEIVQHIRSEGRELPHFDRHSAECLESSFDQFTTFECNLLEFTPVACRLRARRVRSGIVTGRVQQLWRQMMRIEEVEVFSDELNRVVIRYPSRSYPGALVQGKDLVSLCGLISDLCKSMSERGLDALPIEALRTVGRLRWALFEHLHHYNQVLAAHGKPVPWQGLAAECRSLVDDDCTLH